MKILVVDDIQYFCNPLAEAFRQRAEFSTVEVAYSGPEAYKRYNDLKPNYMLLDYELDKDFGTNIAQAILKTDQRIRIILMSGFSDETTLSKVHAIRNLSGFLMKGSHDIQDYPDIILSASRTTPFYSQEYLSAFLAYHKQETFSEKVMTPHQRRILALLGAGLDYAEIGKKLGKAEETVAWHVKILKKIFRVETRNQLRKIAIEKGLYRTSWNRLGLIDKLFE